MAEFLSPEEREREVSRGYLSGNAEGNPLVHFLDYTIAGLGYCQMLKYLWGFGSKDIFKVHYNGAAGKLQHSTCAKAGCINCQEGGHLGRGDKVLPLVPRTDDFNRSLFERMIKEIKQRKSEAEEGETSTGHENPRDENGEEDQADGHEGG